MDATDYISYLNFMFEQVKLQQEVRDRWFRYYLTIAGAVLGTGLAIVKFFYKNNFNSILCLLLLALCVSMALIGICFFMIYLRQRANYIQQYKIIGYVEDKLFSIAEQTDIHVIVPNGSSVAFQLPWKNSLFAIRKHGSKKYGADFFTIWIHIIINALYFASAFIFYVMLVESKSDLVLKDIGLSVVIFSLAASWFEIVRRRHFH